MFKRWIGVLMFLGVLLFIPSPFSTSAACDKLNFIESPGYSDLGEIYTYKMTPFENCGFVGLDCCASKTQATSAKHVPIGAGFPGWDLRLAWQPDGCSAGADYDKALWKTACNVHDLMYGTLPPENVSADDWRYYCDRALLFNEITICQELWPRGSPGLGGCFDSARSSYNILYVLGFGRDAFNNGQNFASTHSGLYNPKRLSLDDYNKIKNYIDEKNKTFPVFGTEGDPGPGVLNPHRR
ncbi:MAG: hypothetical protein HYU52_04695 [Acidobacteria bacterium]|nr:hypothetical protein [Acidobacteriota bacterium]